LHQVYSTTLLGGYTNLPCTLDYHMNTCIKGQQHAEYVHYDQALLLVQIGMLPNGYVTAWSW
jgi:hypothetical protein